MRNENGNGRGVGGGVEGRGGEGMGGEERGEEREREKNIERCYTARFEDKGRRLQVKECV